MFSRFLLFFGAAGADLVHDSPQNPVPPFPFHQVRVPFRRPAGAGLVHDSPQNPVPPFPLHQVRESFRRPAGADLVHDSSQNPVLSSTGTTSLGPKAPPASRTWCFTPRKPLLFRRRAPCLWDQRCRRRAGRGASLPAKPCSFVDGHHVFGAKGAASEPDVVLQSPQSLALSSTGTTSLGPKAPPASDPIIISPRGKELTTNALSLPFVVNSNHSFTPPALICILRHKN